MFRSFALIVNLFVAGLTQVLLAVLTKSSGSVFVILLALLAEESEALLVIFVGG